MSVGYFETPLGPDSRQLYGSIDGFVVQERGEEAVEPTQIIRIDTDWYVSLCWELKGPLSKLICGKWCIHVYLESMGPGDELKLPAYGDYVPLDPCGYGDYKHRIRIPAGTVQAKHCSTPYKLVVGITYLNPCGKPGPIAGFVEGPVLQFFDPN